MRFLLILSLLFLPLAQAQSNKVRLLVQSSPLAGSQYYAVGQFWQELKVGDTLALIREPDNRHDSKAIRVEWRGHRLGYVPRRENGAVAAAMDAGEPLSARISRLTEHADPWRRVEIEIFLPL
ncbi:MAG: hypothetical protein H6R18_2909 [Proteobacteria bacterium]|nr:hypothetical protein [Pseudomonadota bacterium]